MTLPIRQAKERDPYGPSKGLGPLAGMVCFKWPEPGCSQADYLSRAPSTCLSRAACPFCLIHSCPPTSGGREDK